MFTSKIGSSSGDIEKSEEALKRKKSVFALLLTPFLTSNLINNSSESVLKPYNKRVKARAAALRKYFQSGEEKPKQTFSFPCANFASVAVTVCDGFCLNSTAWIRCTWLSRQSDKCHVSSKHVKLHSDHGHRFCKDRWPSSHYVGLFWLNRVFVLNAITTNSSLSEKKLCLLKSVQVCIQLVYLAHLFCLFSYKTLLCIYSEELLAVSFKCAGAQNVINTTT